MMTNSTGSKNNGQKSPVKEGLTQSHYKLIKALNTKKGRSKNALFMAEGNKIIFDLLNTNIKIKTIFFQIKILVFFSTFYRNYFFIMMLCFFASLIVGF